MRKGIISSLAVAMATCVTPTLVTAATATAASATTRAAARPYIPARSNLRPQPVVINPHSFVDDLQLLVRVGSLTATVTKVGLSSANQDVEKALGAAELAAA